MSRTRRAGITAAFGYAHFGLALTTGVLLVPFILGRVGTEAYGLWLGLGELIAYSAMADLGVLGVLPWLVAEKDGARDREGMRAVLIGGLTLAVAAAVVFTVLAAILLAAAPMFTGIGADQRASLAGPLAFLVFGMALAFPARSFTAVLVGLQDASFLGLLRVGQEAVRVLLVITLLLAGHGLYALAAAAVAPAVLGGALSVIRLRRIAPDLFRTWTRPAARRLRRMLTEGMGVWTGSIGWRMVAASSALIVLSLHGPEAAVIFVLTARMAEIGMQMSWQLPDAALVGLAQLNAERRPERVRQVVLSLFRVTLVLIGGVACAVLAFNGSFVAVWVGADRFAGLPVNVAIVLGILGLSLVHALFTTAATLGARVETGLGGIVHGVVHIGAAVVLGSAFGLAGVAAATLLAAAVTAVPIGSRVLRGRVDVGALLVWRQVIQPWSIRGVPLLFLSTVIGAAAPGFGPWLVLAAAPVLGILYLWSMRSLLTDLPFPAWLRPVLERLRLLPGSAPRPQGAALRVASRGDGYL